MLGILEWHRPLLPPPPLVAALCRTKASTIGQLLSMLFLDIGRRNIAVFHFIDYRLDSHGLAGSGCLILLISYVLRHR